MIHATRLALLFIAGTALAADGDTVRHRRTVNDRELGGRSDGRANTTDDETVLCSATLSLESNGSFSSARTQSAPLDSFVAKSFGRVTPKQPRNVGAVSGLANLLRGKQVEPSQFEVAWNQAGTPQDANASPEVICNGAYKHHLQGICAADDAIYWSFTTTLVKTDRSGRLLVKVPVASHHGDLCLKDSKLYVAVNLGKFNDPSGNADSWVYVYDADSLIELARHETQEVFHGAGGIGVRDGHFFVVGGLPGGVEENYVYEYDDALKFLTKHVIKSGHTLLGIQTATFAHDRWWFGCYGNPRILLVTDADFNMKGRFEFDCSLGIEGLPDGRLLVARGRCEKDTGCTGRVVVAVPDETAGLVLLNQAPESNHDQ